MAVGPRALAAGEGGLALFMRSVPKDRSRATPHLERGFNQKPLSRRVWLGTDCSIPSRKSSMRI